MTKNNIFLGIKLCTEAKYIQIKYWTCIIYKRIDLSNVE